MNQVAWKWKSVTQMYVFKEINHHYKHHFHHHHYQHNHHPITLVSQGHWDPLFQAQLVVFQPPPQS